MRPKAEGEDYQFKGGEPVLPDYLVIQIGDYIMQWAPDVDIEWD